MSNPEGSVAKKDVVAESKMRIKLTEATNTPIMFFLTSNLSKFQIVTWPKA